MKVIFTKHVEDKLLEKESLSLGVSKKLLKEVLTKPITIDKKIFPHRAVGRLNNTLSLCVIYKIEKRSILVITFYPAAKGRYESKVLRRRRPS